MKPQEINQAYSRIIGSLDNKELKSAFDSLQELISANREYAAQDKLNELQNTYKYMLRYRIEGVQDPMQHQIYRNLQISVYELADGLRRSLLGDISSLSYYACRRKLQMSPPVSFGELHSRLSAHYRTNDLPQYEATLALLFNRIWVSDVLSPDDYVAIKEITEDASLPHTTGCQVASALTMGLLAAFDKEKLMLLFDAAHSKMRKEIRIRALIGVLLTLYLYKSRTALYPQIGNRLDALAEEAGFTRILRTIILRFILARETEKITRKWEDEIIPEMIKLNPKLIRSIREEELNLDPAEGTNPEWENILPDSPLGKKMEEISELQQEGADVMHSTFIHLKHFPFFQNVCNWFMPFTPEHSLLNMRNLPDDKRKKDAMTTLTLSPSMCNSDKYSLYLSIMQMPKQIRKKLMEQVCGLAHDMQEQRRGELNDKQRQTETIAGQYIKDLYRFFKLYPQHLDFEDIFVLPLDFHNLPALQPYLSDEESLTVIADYYLQKNYFDDALIIYTRLSETRPDSDTLFQKTGYCKQMKGDSGGALEAYLHAHLLNAESIWLIRRIAGCYRALKQPKEALAYYRQYEELNPNNLAVQLSIGHCYMELKEYGEALKYYFKVDYLDAKSHKAWRPIAWCSFLAGKYDQARRYYKKIFTDTPDMHDCLNAGHTEWALHNIKGSLAYYKQAIQSGDSNFHKFREELLQDMPHLVAAGIEEAEFPLMLDQLQYDLLTAP
jgi:tetratricopeptide (TPR) repeat protein